MILDTLKMVGNTLLIAFSGFIVGGQLLALAQDVLGILVSIPLILWSMFV